MKIWDKGTDINKLIEDFTVGRDRELDLLLARYDVLGSLAHTRMLHKIGLLSKDDLNAVQSELKNIYKTIEEGNFIIEEGIEDVHSQVEYLLTQKIGDAGKKIHAARSRNDQVLLDLKLFIRENIFQLSSAIESLFKTLLKHSEANKAILMPGYTHLQVAMPSSFGLWFGSYAEGLADDLQVLQSAYKVVNQNPLGSAASYGSSFPIDRQMTTDLLGFDSMNYNVLYAQMGRGKVEKLVAFALGSVASTLSRMAYDLCMFMSQNFGFITLPDEFTTGSSIMPHKKNPDVFELIRAKCNKVQALSNEITLITNNLPSGYFRDMQIVKESFLETFDYLLDSVQVADFVIDKIKVSDNILDDEKYKYLFSVEEVNKRVLEGKPFREAYREVGIEINQGKFNPDKTVKHTHEGSIGNLCTQKIAGKFDAILSGFNFTKYKQAENELLK